MAHLNRTQIIGNLTADAETITGKHGEFMTFTVAVNGSYSNKEGTRVDKSALYINCTSNNTKLSPYLKKGNVLFVEGEIGVDAYVNKENQPVGKLILRSETIQLLTPKSTEPD